MSPSQKMKPVLLHMECGMFFLVNISGCRKLLKLMKDDYKRKWSVNFIVKLSGFILKIHVRVTKM